MKNKLFILGFLLLIASAGFSQALDFSASVTKSSGQGSVTVFLKPTTSHTGKVSGVTVTLAIPTSVGTRPTVTVDNSPNTFVVYTIQNAIDQSISGVPHYIYNLLGTGDVVPAGATVTFPAGVNTPILKATFTGSNGISSLVKMVNLPNGGTDPNPNSFFGFSMDGSDLVNETNMFFSIPTFSTANNEVIPGGYSGLSLAQTTELVPIPVKFVSFTATRKDNDGLLNWTVENESLLTDRYEVERSLNGTTFEKIATVAPKNNGASSNIYNLTDANLSSLRSSGIIYYRIKQVDKDGKFVYTEIRSIRLEGKGLVIGVYPNPAKDVANVTIDVPEASTVLIYVTDAAGKEIQKITMAAAKGLNTKKVNLLNLSAGTYMFKIAAGDEVKTIPVIKAQ